MKVVLIVLAVLVVLIIAFIVWRYVATMLASERLRRRLYEALAAVSEALEAGKTPDPMLIQRFARSAATRKVLWEILQSHERLDLYPEEYASQESLAEADIVLWLCHPNELQSPPDEIELMATVPSPSSTVDAPANYYVFRYRVNPPHWAANDGWMAGVAGPYGANQDAKPHASGTFSRFEAYDSRTPEQHVAVTHDLIMGKRK
ncbi:MAG: hypothetical protein IT365_26990 [Candidatus Hydrogenedentes bacterium]|nr:hypothetical protein [Candidatus Hydrogenedentota bacterium]